MIQQLDIYINKYIMRDFIDAVKSKDWKKITELIKTNKDEIIESIKTNYSANYEEEETKEPLLLELIISYTPLTKLEAQTRINLLYPLVKDDNFCIDPSTVTTILSKNESSIITIFAQHIQRYKDSVGRTGLHRAILENKTEVIRAILANKDIDLNIQDDRGDTALHTAVLTQKLEMVKSILQNEDIDLNIQNKRGDTALHIAVILNDIELVKKLLSKPDINLKIKNADEKTPLEIAKEKKYIKILEEISGKISDTPFINNFIDAIEQNNWQQIPKLIEEDRKKNVLSELISTDLINKIISYKPKHKLENHNRNDLLSHLIKDNKLCIKQSTVNTILYQNDSSIITIFAQQIQRYKDENGNTPLHTAAFLGQTEIMEGILADQNVDLNIQNHNGYTALHLAVTFTRIELVEKLLENPNIDLNIKNHNGDTALHLAVRRNNIKLVQELLRKPNIDLNIKNHDNETPLDIAIKNKYDKISTALSETEPALTLMSLLGNAQTNKRTFGQLKNPKNGSEETIKKSKIENNLNDTDLTAYKDEDGNTPLHTAILEGKTEVVKTILKKPNIDLNIKNNNGDTALHLAARLNNIKLVQELLQQNIIIDSQNKKGETPLHTAAGALSIEIVELLITHARNKGKEELKKYINLPEYHNMNALYSAVLANKMNPFTPNHVDLVRKANTIQKLLEYGSNQPVAKTIKLTLKGKEIYKTYEPLQMICILYEAFQEKYDIEVACILINEGASLEFPDGKTIHDYKISQHIKDLYPKQKLKSSMEISEAPRKDHQILHALKLLLEMQPEQQGVFISCMTPDIQSKVKKHLQENATKHPSNKMASNQSAEFSKLVGDVQNSQNHNPLKRKSSDKPKDNTKKLCASPELSNDNSTISDMKDFIETNFANYVRNQDWEKIWETTEENMNKVIEYIIGDYKKTETGIRSFLDLIILHKPPEKLQKYSQTKTDLVSYLATKHPDFHINVKTAIYALHSEQEEIITILAPYMLRYKARSDGNTLFHEAILKGKTKAIDAILANKNIDLNIQNNLGNTPLHLAVISDNVELVEKLLERTDINLKIKNTLGDTPLDIINKKTWNKNIPKKLLEEIKTVSSSISLIQEHSPNVDPNEHKEKQKAGDKPKKPSKTPLAVSSKASTALSSSPLKAANPQATKTSFEQSENPQDYSQKSAKKSKKESKTPTVDLTHKKSPLDFLGDVKRKNPDDETSANDLDPSHKKTCVSSELSVNNPNNDAIKLAGEPFETGIFDNM